MGFRVTANTSHDWVKIAELASANPFLNIWHPDSSELECESADQATLDTAFAGYVADQANIDAATQAAKVTVDRDNQKDMYDVKRVLRGLVEALVDEINLLRQQFNTTTAEVASATNTTFNDRTVAQARTAILNAIDNL